MQFQVGQYLEKLKMYELAYIHFNIESVIVCIVFVKSYFMLTFFFCLFIVSYVLSLY